MAESKMDPIKPAERINEIDLIRGFALFGILIVNMSFFKLPVFFDRNPTSFTPGMDQVWAWVIQLFFTGKFYAIFSFLFGLGFYIFMDRTLKKGLELAPIYRRRLWALLFFGLIHLVMLWTGDILFTYALVGFILLRFREKSPEALERWIKGLFISSFLLHFLFGLFSGFGELMTGDQYGQMMTQMIDGAIVVYRNAAYWQLVSFRAANELPYVLLSLIVAIPAVLAFFLCGLYAGKRRLFSELQAHLPLFRKIRNYGLPLGALLMIVYSLIESGILPVGILLKPALLSASNYLASIFIFPAYIATLVLAVQNGFWKKLLSPLAACGRMALTNYLMQTLIAMFIFYGFGLGYYAAITVLQGIALTVAIFIAQVILSNFWIKWFRYGPMEWLWRVLTYKKIQPFLAQEHILPEDSLQSGSGGTL